MSDLPPLRCSICNRDLLPTNDDPDGFCAECALLVRNGDLRIRERWRRVPTKPQFEVSDHGNVRRRDTREPVAVDYSGRYPRVSLAGERCRLHTLVLLAFVGPRPEGQLGLHLDDEPTHCALWNLSWGTSEMNAADAKRNRCDSQASA